jgi:hypothetical protein
MPHPMLRRVLQAARSSLADSSGAGAINAVFDSVLSSDDLDWLASMTMQRDAAAAIDEQLDAAKSAAS